MSTDDFSIVPEDEIKRLRKDIEDVKKNPLASSPTGQDLLGSVNSLNSTIGNMVQLFQGAAESMKKEDEELSVFAKEIKPLLKKLDEVIEQNEKIAKGIVALAELVKDKKAPDMPKMPATTPNPMPKPTSMPSMTPPAAPAMPPPNMAPPTGSQPPAPNIPPPNNAPPGPPPFSPSPLPRSGEPEKKKSLFGFGK